MAKTRDLVFGKALDVMRDGGAARLPWWYDGRFARIQKRDKNSKMTIEYLYTSDRNETKPWTPTNEEILSEEWTVIPI